MNQHIPSSPPEMDGRWMENFKFHCISCSVGNHGGYIISTNHPHVCLVYAIATNSHQVPCQLTFPSYLPMILIFPLHVPRYKCWVVI